MAHKVKVWLGNKMTPSFKGDGKLTKQHGANLESLLSNVNCFVRTLNWFEVVANAAV